MYTGSKYDINRDIKTIAKLVRTDIKQAIQEGKLPKGTKISVRIERYSMGRSLNLVIKALPGVVIENPKWIDAYYSDDPELKKRCAHRFRNTDPEDYFIGRFTSQALDTEDFLNRLVSEYNFDKSDSMTDYYHTNFHQDIQFAEELLPYR